MATSDKEPDDAANTSGWLKDALRPFQFISTMRERKQIRRMCVDTLEQYRRIEGEAPKASNEELYARVIETRIGGARPGAVQEAMRRTKESFATWPVDRPLTLRDIAQYIVVTESLRNDIAVTGVSSRAVDYVLAIAADVIPENL